MEKTENRQKGHWIPKQTKKQGIKYYCSNCGAPMFPTALKPPFCWCCGHEMCYINEDF